MAKINDEDLKLLGELDKLEKLDRLDRFEQTIKDLVHMSRPVAMGPLYPPGSWITYKTKFWHSTRHRNEEVGMVANFTTVWSKDPASPRQLYKVEDFSQQSGEVVPIDDVTGPAPFVPKFNPNLMVVFRWHDGERVGTINAIYLERDAERRPVRNVYHVTTPNGSTSKVPEENLERAATYQEWRAYNKKSGVPREQFARLKAKAPRPNFKPRPAKKPKEGK